MDLIKIIRENKLIYLKLDSLAKELAKITGEAIADLKLQINDLIHDGTLYLDGENKISISADKGYFKAKITLNRKGYGFARVDGYPDFFVPAFAINGAYDGDDCLVEITSRKSDDEIEGKVVKVLRHNTTHIVGTYIIGKSKSVVFPDDDKLPQIRILKSNSKNAKNNEKVWVELNAETLDAKEVSGKIVEILGQANTPKAEQLSIIRSFKLIDQFDPETLREARAISQTVDRNQYKKRVDFASQRVITIDGEDARDFDDAIAVERSDTGYKLFVHIADVSEYVRENSHLDKEAFRRGTSVYFSNQVIPMLPKELSNGVCSLSEGVDRLVLSVVIDLNDDCEVLDSKIVEGMIHSHHRMTYTEIKNILEGDQLLIEKYQDVYNDILIYQEISKKLLKKRHDRGEIRMNIPEPYILENEVGEIVSIEKRVQDEAHQIIESLMILTNECVAKRFFDLKIPFVYRVHEKPDSEKVLRLSELLKNMGVANQLQIDGDKPISYQKIIESIKDNPSETTLTKLILRSMMKARYTPTCLGHFGLASEYYCHFTSPIRRYPDLMIHRIIKNYLNGVPVQDLKLKYTSIVARASEQSSETEKIADEAEREVDDYKKAVYMTQFIGEQFVGTISGVQEFGIFVELDNGIEGLVRLEDLPSDEYVYDESAMTLKGKKHHYTIGDSVRIIVANANTKLRQVDFDLVGVEKNTLGSFVVKKKDKSSKKLSKKSSNILKIKNSKRKKKR